MIVNLSKIVGRGVEMNQTKTGRVIQWMKVFFPIIVSALILVIFASSCGYGTTNSGGGTQTVSGNKASISLKNVSFNPSELTISPGTTVTWTNDDNTTHTVTSDSGVFDSGNLGSGKSFSYTFNQAGSYPFHCGIHSSMKGTITVQAGATGGNTGGTSSGGGGSGGGLPSGGGY